MPRNASGIYNLPAGNPVVAGSKIQTSWANSTLQDVANEISGSLDRQGRSNMSGSLRLADGETSFPGLTFNSDTNCGLVRLGADDWGLVAGGVLILRLTSTQLHIMLDSFQLGGEEFNPADYAKLAGATFSGAVQVNNNLDVTENMQVVGRMEGGNSRAILRRTNFMLGTNDTAIQFDSAAYNIAGAYNPSAFTWAPNYAGFYIINMGVRYDTGSGQAVAAQVRVNGNPIAIARNPPAPNDDFLTLNIGTLAYLAENDVVSGHLFVSGAGVVLREADYGTFLSIHMVP